MSVPLPGRSSATHHFHVGTPGDHFSPATGSAVSTIIYEIARQHASHGGQTDLAVGRGTRNDYDIGRCVEVDYPPAPTRAAKLVDVTLGNLGRPRKSTMRRYLPSLAAIAPDFDGSVFVHNSPPATQLIAQRRPDAQTVLWAHNELFRTYSSSEARRTLAATDRIVCCSQFIADQLTSKLGRPTRSIIPLANGVDVDRFRPTDGAADDDRSQRPPIILFLGRVLPEKGPDLLLKAAKKIVSRHRQFKVRIVGSSNFNSSDPLTQYQASLHALATELHDRVEFQPFVDRARVLDEYRAASIFCVPSNWDEPVSLTISEGMASGLPVVAARRGGIPEVGGDAVLYFDPPDVDTLADQLAWLVDDPGARLEWGARARQRSLLFSWESRYHELMAALAD